MNIQVKVIERKNKILNSKCPGGEIGRHKGLKIHRKVP